MNHDVFISYSKKDADRIKPLRRALDAAKIKYWIDDRIDGSANFLAEIPEAISHCSIVLFVASEDSARSVWTQKELLYAQKHKKDIFPYKLDNNFKFENCAELDFFFTNIQWKESVDDVVAGFSKKLGISNTPHKVAQNIIKDSSEKLSHKSVGSAPSIEDIKPVSRSISKSKIKPIQKPSIKPTLDKIKRYWWVALCVLVIGCAMLYITTDKEEKKGAFIASLKQYEEKNDNNNLLNFPDSVFVRLKEGDKYGYNLESTGEIVIPLKYDNAYDFSEGLAIVKLNGKYGFIDKTGKEVIPLKYDNADSFREGLAWVELNGKYSFIDKTGKEVFPLKYDFAFPFTEGLAVVELNGKHGYIDKTGNEVIPLKYDLALPFSEGMARVTLNGKDGFIDKTGKEVIPLKYDDASLFSKGKAKVKLNGETFYIDKNGNRVEE